MKKKCLLFPDGKLLPKVNLKGKLLNSLKINGKSLKFLEVYVFFIDDKKNLSLSTPSRPAGLARRDRAQGGSPSPISGLEGEKKIVSLSIISCPEPDPLPFLVIFSNFQVAPINIKIS